MLKSLYIQNYRCLDSLRIHQLKRVNLITGKNNTGKSSILEAMAIYASSGNIGEIINLLEEHGEYAFDLKTDNVEVDSYELIRSIFTNKEIDYCNQGLVSIDEINEVNSILIEDFKMKESHKKKSSVFDLKNSVMIACFEYVQNSRDNKIQEIVQYNDNPAKLSLVVKSESTNVFDLDSALFNKIVRKYPIIKSRYHLVKTSHINRDENGVLFDKIALTDNEKYVIEALQIIEPKIERIAFIQDNPLAKLRVSKVKLKDSIGTVPLRSMGDGINRILTIILALINSKDGYLMIDEFENGLHHSVQAKLWEIIIKLSKELNVQVFVTTHSNDTIRSVRNALSEMSEEDKNDVSTIKLMRTHEDKLEALLYDYEQLDYVIEQDIEIR